MKDGNSIGWKRISILAGALCAYLIGAATATGQESLQFYASHGYISIASIVIASILFGWAGSSIIALGRDTSNTNSSAYKHYFGNVIGTVFEWFVIMFLFCLVVTLISGSGTVIAEFYGVNKLVGSTLMAGLIFITLLLSLNKLVDVLGWVAPLIIIFIIIISVISITNNMNGLINAGEVLGEIEAVRAVNSWWFSGVLYSAFGITVAAPFLLQMGLTANSHKEAFSGIWAGIVVYALTTVLITLALLANLTSVFDKEAPLVFLANQLHPVLAIVFSIVIYAGIYTTAAPMFWYVCNRISSEKTRKHTIIASILIVIAFIGGIYLPFGKLVGTVYPLTGYLGIFLYIAIGYSQIKNRMKSRVSSNAEKELLNKN
ncbi:hypothetical protein AB1K83_07305 [Sporosarcina sp. 179-K 3D1 HS]|uniref:YkvI family membrane protein n=1 Tax=Sporosarcina sp. 179-K 3D1 HS TaxID=3232169 RepID=UPI0039A20EE0